MCPVLKGRAHGTQLGQGLPSYHDGEVYRDGELDTEAGEGILQSEPQAEGVRDAGTTRLPRCQEAAASPEQLENMGHICSTGDYGNSPEDDS